MRNRGDAGEMGSFKRSSNARSHREGRGAREERSKQERIEGTGKERRREKTVFLAIWDF